MSEETFLEQYSDLPKDFLEMTMRINFSNGYVIQLSTEVENYDAGAKRINDYMQQIKSRFDEYDKERKKNLEFEKTGKGEYNQRTAIQALREDFDFSYLESREFSEGAGITKN